MNERIRELIEMATIRGQEYLSGNNGHLTPTFYFDKEKFAELIVKECAELVDNDRLMTAADTYDEVKVAVYDTKDAAARKILTRFGVAL